MNFNRKVRLFFSTDWKLLMEAYILLGWARIQKLRSFSRVCGSLGDQSRESTFSLNGYEHRIARNISVSIHIMSRYTFWESECLVKAMAAMKMLEKRNIESTLYLGTSKDEKGRLIAHAWLRSGPYYVTGFEGMKKFTVVGTFAKRFSTSRGENHG